MDRAEKHPLRGLLVSQFFGAFNDNAWKLMVTFLAIDALKKSVGDSGPDFQAASQTQTMIAFAVFTVPLMLFSLPASFFADRFSKRSLILAMKAVEVVLMASGCVALLLYPEQAWVRLAILALMGVQSAVFSPAKYGILPEILPHHRLSAGNGALEMWTFLAIIGGTAAAGFLLEFGWASGLVLTLLSIVGFCAALRVPKVPAASAGAGFGAVLSSAWNAIRAERVLFLTVLGMTFYWAIASLLGQDILVYAKSVLQRTEKEAGLLLACFGLGVGGGSVLAGRLSHAKVEYGLMPFGALGLSISSLLLGICVPETFDGSDSTYYTLLVLVIPLGVSSGLLIIPLNALLQWRSPANLRGAVIALSNVFVFAGVLGGSFLAEGLSRVGLSAREILVAGALLVVVGTGWALWLLPDAMLRFVLILLTQTLYRLKVVGRQHVPSEGGALLVPNHVSFVDGLFILAATDRPVRFLIESAYFHHPLLKPFLKPLGAIPLASSGGPRVILRALRDAGKYLDDGELVCIFAEGQITRTGMLLPFRRGLERIVKGRNTSIVPVHLDKVWGSIFSWSGERFVTKFPRRIPYPVTVSFGEPLPSGTPIYRVRRAVHELGQDAWLLRKNDRPPLHHTFVRGCRVRPFSLAFADESKPRVLRFKSLAGVVALARALRTGWKDQQRVGILLPPSVAGATANLASSLSGRTSVNLNYTSGAAGMESATRQSELETILTSRNFLEKAGLELPKGVEPLWIEDVVQTVDWRGRLVAFALALLAPCRLLESACGAKKAVSADDVVTIIFSSGSTGEPKGVLLSHFNVDSNSEAIAQVIRPSLDDRLLGVLPLFHSFGYMALWFASNHGMATVFHANPLDAAKIGDLVQRYRVSLMIATPTFLQIYMRRCTPAEFGSIRMLLTGAEKLPDRVASSFEDSFGIRPLEGYGTTECSPAVAVSSLDYRAPGFYQPGSRRGTVGQPLPGVAVRIVDPEAEFDPSTSESLPSNTPGLLVVKGPNVMQGYLGREDLTAAVIKDGWYITGDIATLDEDGFLRITDRLSRFSKIGGEMVPHGAVEDALHEAAGSEIQVFAVTSVADEKKGEKLAVLYTLDEAEIPEIAGKLAEMGLPNLFVPRVDQFVSVEQLPLLGTGKLDLREMKRLALEALALR